MAGLCHYPKPIQESITEALACASRASTILSRDTLELESITSRPIDENCDGCAFCVDACPFGAISLLEYRRDGNVKKTVEVNQVLCHGCGSCMATCPKNGIYVAGFSLNQLEAQVDAALGLFIPLPEPPPPSDGTTPLAREVSGKKFVWDGTVYTDRFEAQHAAETYEQDGFEVHLFVEKDKPLVYTRKLATQETSAI